jgi:hypothetical protein
MTDQMIVVTAWNNGAEHPSGAGYGLKISKADRDRYFRRTWREVRVRLPSGKLINVNTDKKSFWGPSCRESISVGIGECYSASISRPGLKGSPLS